MGAGDWFFSVEEVIQYQRCPAEGSGFGYSPANKVMSPIIRMGIRADCQTPTAVSADNCPVMVAGFRDNFPAQNAVIHLSISVGDGMAGAVISAFLADIAEIDQASIRLVAVCDQG